METFKTVTISLGRYDQIMEVVNRVKIFEKDLNRKYRDVCMIRKEDVAAALGMTLEEENGDVYED